jgi:Aerobic-type carbon monoxide dehydrogenase, small subunit CoxS/CutS homologs
MSNLKVSITVNGERKEAEIEPRMLLVHFIREVAGLTGTHVGCDTTNCGACTVLLDGRAVKSCTVLAAQANGKKVTTIEGLSKGENKLHPVQKAFVDKHGLQCGFCTSGMIMTSFWLLNKKRKLSEEEIREAISGNLCRCTGYESIVDSIQEAERRMDESEEYIEEEIPARRSR